MSAIPSNLARVPTALVSQIMVNQLNNTSQDLLRLQVQMSTGKAVNRASDDAVATSAISVLDDVIERRNQRLRNLSHGEAVLNNIDAAVADASDLLLEAKGVALSQIGLGSDSVTRENQAAVIDSMLDEMVNIANRKFQELHYFGGSATGSQPITILNSGLKYNGTGVGLETDLGLSRPIAITSSGEEVFGALSSRVEGDTDLDPGLTTTTRLSDINGAKGLGIRLGSVNVDVNGTDITVDLSAANVFQDITSALQTAIQTIDAGAVVQIDPTGKDGIEIIPSAGVTVTISDISAEATAADLGIAQAFPAGGAVGSDVDANLTETTLLANLSGVTTPLGSIQLSNGGQVRTLDLSSATSVQDVMNAVHGLGIGIRVEISDSKDRLNFVNELSGGLMSIGESGGSTATELGVRSLNTSTLLTDFNNGLGVSVISGSTDPVTGLADPARDLDFQLTAKDGTTFDVDLAGDVTVQDVLATINAAAAAAGLTVGAGNDFNADFVSTGNGVRLTDNTNAGVGTTTVASLNGSTAATDLGIIGSTTSASLDGTDRATVAVDSIFSTLIALRDALRTDDQRGITLAGEKLESGISSLAKARADIGVRTRRVIDQVGREEDLKIQDINLRSGLRDLDFTDAAIRFATLQQQLQAGLTTAGRVTSLTLLDFIR